MCFKLKFELEKNENDLLKKKIKMDFFKTQSIFGLN